MRNTDSRVTQPGPLDSRTKEDQVADYLREAIIAGAIERGARLKQADIARQLNTSITPVREALKLLEAEGYVSSNSYRSTIVVPLDPGASAEILNLRLLLETKLVCRAVEKVSSADLDDLRQLSEEFEAAVARKDSSMARGANYRFHHRLYAIADLPQTMHFVQILWARFAHDLINKAEGRAEQAVREHAELLLNVVEGNATGAMLSLRKHIESGWDTLRDAVEGQQHDPSVGTPRSATRRVT